MHLPKIVIETVDFLFGFSCFTIEDGAPAETREVYVYATTVEHNSTAQTINPVGRIPRYDPLQPLLSSPVHEPSPLWSCGARSLTIYSDGKRTIVIEYTLDLIPAQPMTVRVDFLPAWEGP